MNRAGGLLLVVVLAVAARAEPTPDQLVARLGSESFAVREKAFQALVEMGEKAIGALEKAKKSENPEVRLRAARALSRIRWHVGPKLAARIGDLMDDFATLPVGERERVCRDLAMVGLDAAVPTLKKILTTDPSPAVRQAAARALVLVGDEGLAALLEAGVQTKNLDPFTVAVRIHLGNSYLDRGEFDKALEQYRRALEIEPDNSIAHYNVACTYSRMKRIKEALDALERAIECGYRDVEWMEKDSDLDNLRDTARYKALVRRLREQASE